jgi:hypothetical protein
MSEVAKAPHEKVTEDGVPQMTDVSRLVGVDVGVLDDRLATVAVVRVLITGEELGEHVVAGQEEVEETGSCDLDPDDLLRPFGALVDLLGDLPRSGLEFSSQRQGTGPGEITELALRRHLEPHLVGTDIELRLERRRERLHSPFLD